MRFVFKYLIFSVDLAASAAGKVLVETTGRESFGKVYHRLCHRILTPHLLERSLKTDLIGTDRLTNMQQMFLVHFELQHLLSIVRALLMISTVISKHFGVVSVFPLLRGKKET